MKKIIKLFKKVSEKSRDVLNILFRKKYVLLK